MSTKSFYDLDYIIELNEKRLEQYTAAYQKVLERLTNIILVYSGLAIFLIAFIQDINESEVNHWAMKGAFTLFSVLFAISIVFTIKLIIPVEVAYLETPKKYYEEYRLRYEQTINHQGQVSKLLKASYIKELEIALDTNGAVFQRKSSFYYNALMFGLLSVIPYLICLGFHISKKSDSTQKIQLVQPEINSILHKIDSMAKSASTNNSSSTVNTTTKLPGVVDNQVIVSRPKLIKENSQGSTTKKK